jgi:hypothetical protein
MCGLLRGFISESAIQQVFGVPAQADAIIEIE